MSNGPGGFIPPMDDVVRRVMEEAQARPVTVGEQIGVGPRWAPGVAAQSGYEWGRLDGGPGGPVFVLKMTTGVGVFGFVFDRNGLERMLEDARRTMAGITVPTAGYPDPTRLTIGDAR